MLDLAGNLRRQPFWVLTVLKTARSLFPNVAAPENGAFSSPEAFRLFYRFMDGHGSLQAEWRDYGMSSFGGRDFFSVISAHGDISIYRIGKAPNGWPSGRPILRAGHGRTDPQARATI